MELGYDSRGSSSMLSVMPSSTVPSVLHLPLPMYVPLMNFYGMNFPHRPSSIPLPILMFFRSYSAQGIALPSLPTLLCFVSPVGSIVRHTQQHHQCLLQPFHNPFEESTTTSSMHAILSLWDFFTSLVTQLIPPLE